MAPETSPNVELLVEPPREAAPGADNLRQNGSRAAGSEDIERHNTMANNSVPEKASTFQSLGLLDRFLAVWILLAMVAGVLLGNFVPETGVILQKGKFVGVSVPVGTLSLPLARVGRWHR